MIDAAVLLASIGIADLIRSLVRGYRASVALGILATVAICAGAQALVGTAWWVTLLAAALAACWMPTMTTRLGTEPHRIWPAIVVVATVVVVVVAIPPTAVTPDGVRNWYALTAPGAAGVAWETFVVVIGVVAFLLSSTNLLVRAAINSRAAAHGSVTLTLDGVRREPAPESGGWRIRVGRRAIADIEAIPATGAAAPQLVGGRVIGPIERILLVGLGLFGAAPVIAALVAAKGVVRFPEISADKSSGFNAETFLVGSLTSWAVAAGGALLIWATFG